MTSVCLGRDVIAMGPQSESGTRSAAGPPGMPGGGGVIDQLDRYLGRLLDGSGACAAVIWARQRDATEGSIVRTCPAGLLPEGTPWPANCHANSGATQPGTAMLANILPISVQRELWTAPTAALSLELADPDLTLLLIWCGVTPIEELSDDLHDLIEQEIAYAAGILHRQRRSDRAAQRLQAVLDGLKQGVVSVDHTLGRAAINPAAARLLNLAPGDVPESDFEAAVADLETRTLSRSAPAPLSSLVADDPTADIDCSSRFVDAPDVQVSTRPLPGGRVWVFDDASALSHALEVSETARSLLRATTDGMIDPQAVLEAVRDPGGQVVDFVCRSANRAICSYLGMDERDLIGRTALEGPPALDNAALISRYTQCLADGKQVIITDLPIFSAVRDESRRFDIRVARVGIDLVSVNWRDVTDRLEAAERIAASEQSYRMLAETVGEVFCHVRDGRFVVVSPLVDGVLGAPAAHWVGRDVQEVVLPEDLPAYTAMLGRLSAGDTIKGRARLKSIDGVTHWIHLHARPFYAPDGRQDGVAATFRPIDDVELNALRVAEDALAQKAKADERYRRSMDNAAIGMCLISPDGRFEQVNDALCQLFGYDAATLKIKTWQELTAPDYLEADLKNVNDIRAGRLDSYRMLKKYIHADGHPIWGDLSVSCVRDENGNVANFISQITDITAAVDATERSHTLAQRLQQQTDRYTAELQSAAAYMSSIMPRGLTGAVKVSSRYLPSRELGGDCFDYTWIDDDHLVVYLIDVSGHGIEPALLAVSVHNLLRSGSLAVETLLVPDAVLAELNRLFQMDQQGSHYFTIWFGVYQASTRTMRYSSAGAPPALAFESPAGAEPTATALSTTSAPVGMFEDTEFTSHTYPVPPGCRILLYSDGASEVPLDNDRQLTQAEFTELTLRLAASPDWSLDDLIRDVRALNPQGLIDDDCSLIQLAFD